MNYKIILTSFFLLSFLACFGQNRISQDAAWKDIDTLIKTIERVHYNPYLYVPKYRFNQQVENIKNSISGDIDFKSFILKVNSVTALIEDGHTMPYLVQPQIAADLKGLNFLPLQYAFSGNDIFLTASEENYSNIPIPLGAKIISVNGMKVPDELKEYQSLFGGSRYSKKEMAGRLLSYFLFLKGVMPPFIIKYSSGSTSLHTARIDSAITFMSMASKSMPHLVQANYFKIIEERVGYLDFLSMNGDINEWGELLDSAFTVLREKEIKKLIIDIRNNAGGNSLYVNYLLAFITRKKLLLASGKCWKVSEEKKRDLIAEGSNNPAYQERDNGSLWCYEDCIPTDNPVIADSVFDGEVYLLTSPFTFSSANMLADAFKTFQLGTIVGEPTGEYTNDFGETLLFTLPNSKVKIQTTTSFEFGADCNKESLHTVIPDIEIKQTIEDKLSNKDSVLNFILKKKTSPLKKH